jgi:hypothetical protein
MMPETDAAQLKPWNTMVPPTGDHAGEIVPEDLIGPPQFLWCLQAEVTK